MPLKYVPIVNSVTKILKNAKDEIVNRSELVGLSKISVNAISRTGKIDAIRLDTLMKICCVLDCKIDDIVNYC